MDTVSVPVKHLVAVEDDDDVEEYFEAHDDEVEVEGEHDFFDADGFSDRSVSVGSSYSRSSSSASVSADSRCHFVSILEHVIPHLFLPRRIPDFSTDVLDVESWVLQHFSDISNDALQFPKLEPICKMLSAWTVVQPKTSFHKERFARHFVYELNQMELEDTVPLYIRRQNCTLLIRKVSVGDDNTEAHFSIETFRPSLPAEAIMSTVGSFQVNYPETTNFIYNINMLFSEVFAYQLYHLIFDDFQLSLDTTTRGDTTFVEHRSVADPFLVSDWIVALLVPRSDLNLPNFKITKKIRDEVNCRRSAKAVPFRRSGMWTSIKVATHLKLLQVTGSENDSRIIYKCILLRFLADVCKLYVEGDSIHFQMDLGSQIMTKMGKRVRKLQKMSCDKKSGHATEIVNLWSSTLKCVHSVTTTLYERMHEIWKASCGPTSPSEIIQPITRTEDEFRDDLLHHIPWLNRHVTNGSPKKGNKDKIGTKGCQNKRANSKGKQEQTPPSSHTDQIEIQTDMIEKLRRYETFEDIMAVRLRLASAAQTRLWRLDTEYYIKFKLDYSCFENDSKGVINLYTAYLKQAVQGYTAPGHENPICFSQMVLVALKMVQILDQIATKKFRLLRQYKCGINQKVFNKLLLPHSVDMCLLDEILDYFHERDEKAQYDGIMDSLHEEIDPNSFACRFAENDEEMSKLRLKILGDMEMREKEKLTRVDKVREECIQLQTALIETRHNCDSCKHIVAPGEEDLAPNNETGKCTECTKLEDDLQSKRFSIPVYERPVPEEEHLQLAVTFELMIPEEIKNLREGLGLLKFDILGEQRHKLMEGSCSAQLKWLDYRNIQTYKRNSDKALAKSQQTHLNLCSALLPTSSTHLIQLKNPDLMEPSATFVVPNGLACGYHWISHNLLSNQHTLAKLCTFQLESTRVPMALDLEGSDPYSTLQWAVEGTSHSQNRVIGEFSSTLHPEFMAFGSLRAGHRIQLMNLYRYIANRQLQLEKEPVTALIVQTIWQVGPRNKKDRSRESHLDFLDVEFAEEFLEMLEKLIQSNDTNYANPLILLTTVVITLRILELNKVCREKSYHLLRKCRRCAEAWQETIQNEITANSVSDDDDEDNDSLIKIQLEILICSALSFNVIPNSGESEKDVISSVIRDGEDLMHWFQTVTNLYEFTREDEQNYSRQQQVSPFERLLLEVVKQIPLKLNLGTLLKPSSSLNDLFVKSLHLFSCQKWDWAAGAGTWKLAAGSSNVVEGRFQTDILTFDIFHGTFLINGYSRSGLPIRILRDPLFELFFKGSRKLKVVQGPIIIDPFSNARTLLFRTSDRFHGKHYEFVLSTDNLIIRELQEEKSNTNKLELLNPEKFRGVFSDDLVYQYTHWIDPAKKEVYFRRLPIQDSDYSLAPEYTLTFDGQTNMWRLHDDLQSQYIFSRKSKGFKEMAQSVARLEQERYLDVVMKVIKNKQTGQEADDSSSVDSKFQIEIKLPRHRLNFELRKGCIFSVEYKGFKVTTNQMDRGTLISLQQGILMDNSTNITEENVPASGNVVKRIILVPHGQLSSHIVKGQKHQRTQIDMTFLRQPSFFCFEIDPVLKRLKADRSKCAWIYLAALHGFTSSCSPCLPDPFLEMTGTEMAVHILQSGFVWSCAPYDEESLRTLKMIKNLSPRREYYGHGLVSQTANVKLGRKKSNGTRPTLRQQMETTEWPSGLPSIVAYDGFAIIVDKLIEDSNRLSLLFPVASSWYLKETEDEAETIKFKVSEKLQVRAYFNNLSFYNKAANINPIYFRNSTDKLNADAVLPELLLRKRRSSEEDDGSLCLCKGDGKEKLDLDLLLKMSQVRLVSTLQHPLDASKRKSNLSAFLLNPQMDEYKQTGCVLRPALPIPDCQGGIPLKQLLTWDLDENWLQFYTMATEWTTSNEQKQALSIVLSLLAYKGASLDQLFNLHNISVLAENINFPRLPQSLAYASFTDYKALNTFSEEKIKSFLKDRVKITVRSGAHIVENGQVNEEGEFKLKNYEESLAVDDKIDYIVSEVKALWPCETFPRKKLEEIYRETEKFWTHHSLKEMSLMLAKIFRNSQLKQFIENVESYLDKFYQHLPNIPECKKQFDLMKEVKLEIELSPPSPPETYLFKQLSEVSVDGNLDEPGIIFYSGSAFPETNVETLIPTQREQCLAKIETYSARVSNSIIGKSCSKQVIHKAGIAPRTSPLQLLKYLMYGLKSPPGSVHPGLLKLLGALAVMWTELKRFNRLMRLNQMKETRASEFQSELENCGHENWSPVDHPEWLLLELDADIMIRPIQVNVAKQMIKMPDGGNGVMQLNMGEGKTSVIVPMVCLALANEQDSLCRVTVLNSIYKTNLNQLSFTLGGLLSRRVYTFPCRRDMKFNLETLDIILKCYQECLKLKGVVFTLPEYRLSFRLLAFDRSLKGYPEIGVKFLEIENGLCRYARDIVDESDEILNVKYQLVYTIGSQLSLDGGNLRWVVCQRLLQVVQDVAWVYLAKMGTSFIELHKDQQQSNPEQFAHIRLLDKDGFEEFNSLVADELLKEMKLTERQKQALKKYLTQEKISSENFKSAMSLFKHDTCQLNEIRLLSGYLRHGILTLALGKRWRVDYGVDPNGHRLMAVPFRAKDVAAEKTEFGQPDLAIVLTELSYYYAGLSDSELDQCFNILKSKQDAETLYSSFIAKIPQERVPKFLTTFAGINLQDNYQRINLFNLLRKHKAVIDFWLSNKVFPRECKQFPGKIVMSSWDLCNERQRRPITGFSGTNDSSVLLPLPISQQDLLELKETNQRMERILLRSENSCHRGFRMNVTCKEILEEMKRDSIKVLIDAGASMLECNNEQVAHLWLETDPQIEAVVYFNNQNDLVVKVRQNHMPQENEAFQKKYKRVPRHYRLHQHHDQLLELSPYKEMLEKCGVFLDDQHTRGTDLKFGFVSKAAVTIGSRMRRDKLIQACMRMRQLGNGHSVTFYLSHEAHDKILKRANKSSISTESILNWVSDNTKEHNNDGLVYWATSGKNYAQKLAAEDFHYSVDTHPLEKIYTLSRQCLDDEVLSIQDLYGSYTESNLLTKVIWDWFEHTQRKLLNVDGCCSLSQQITRRFDSIRDAILERIESHIPDKMYQTGGLSTMEGEEEKEVEKEKEVEMEEERQLETPRRLDYADNLSVHENVKQTVLHGLKITVKPGISRLSEIFEKTSFVKIIQPEGWSSAEVFATTDFISVVKPFAFGNSENSEEDNEKNVHFRTDLHLRPIEFLVSIRPQSQKTTSKGSLSPSPLQILVLSPFEVNELLPYFRNAKARSHLHMFTPRLFPKQNLLLNNASLQVPRPHVLQSQNAAVHLNNIPDGSKCLAAILLASGNLYFDTMEEQTAFSQFLGMVPRPWNAEQMNAFEKEMIKKTGFLLPKYRKQNMDSCHIELDAFQKDPVGMVRKILMCRHAVISDVTHVNRLLNLNWIVQL